MIQCTVIYSTVLGYTLEVIYLSLNTSLLLTSYITLKKLPNYSEPQLLQ